MRPHLHAPRSTRALIRAFIVASIPTAVIGIWNLGHQTLLAANALGDGLMTHPAAAVLQALGVPQSADSVTGSLLFGLLHVLPLMATVFAVGYAWERLVSKQRQRAMDPAWPMTAWLLLLLLPPATPLMLAAVAMSFSMIIGTHIFGGTGRYLVSPALIGVLFLHFAYPGFVSAALPLPELELDTSWSLAAHQGTASLSLSSTLLGKELGAIGTTSTLGALLGAGYLLRVGAASPRTLLGALGALAATAWLLNLIGSSGAAWQLPWYWHLALGHFAFAIAFIATDPTTAALTPGGRWLHGALIGVLTVLLRVGDPSHPEGTLFAVLLAGLCVPLLDHITVRVFLWRTQRQRAAVS